MKKIIFIFFVMLVLGGQSAYSQTSADILRPKFVSEETKALVRTLLEANGMRSSMIRIFEDIIRQAPADKQQDLRSVLKGDAIIDNMIPVYAKHFTNAELKEMINFYKSPIGVKNLSLTPVLMTEVMQVSQKYFEESVKGMEYPLEVPGAGAKTVK